MQTHTLKKRIFGIMGLTVVALLFMCAPDAYALIDTSIDTEFIPLTNIPYFEQMNSASNFGEYVNAIYKVIIILGALVGVLRIAWAGVKWSMSDIVTSKEEAKSDIRGVLFGLIILLIPFIVLNTIYKGLTNLDVFSGKGLGVDLSGRNPQQQAVDNRNAVQKTCEAEANKSVWKKIVGGQSVFWTVRYNPQTGRCDNVTIFSTEETPQNKTCRSGLTYGTKSDGKAWCCPTPTSAGTFVCEPPR